MEDNRYPDSRYPGNNNPEGYSQDRRYSSDRPSNGQSSARRPSNGYVPSGDKYRYTPRTNMPTSEKQKEYYRQLANERGSARPENYRPAHASGNRPNVSTTVGRPNPSSSNKNSKRRKKKGKMGKGKKALISIICILLVLVLAVGGTGFYFLNRFDFDNGQLVAAPRDPNADGEDEADNLGDLSDDEKKDLADADKSINANLDNNQIWYSDQVTNILLMGIDYGSDKYPYGRSDSMIIVSINDATQKVKLVSLSRAVYAAIPGYNNTRLSHAHGYGGAPLAIQAIQNNYKIRIDNYASVNFQGFENIINALGGVTVSLDGNEARAISHLIGTSSAGTYNLNGRQALAFARTRKIDNDRSRTGRQRRILEALASKATNMSIPQMMSAMNEILPNVRTDMSRSQIISMVSKVFTYLNYQRSEDVIPHESSALTPRGGFEVLLVNWEKEVKYAHELLYGEVEAKIA